MKKEELDTEKKLKKEEIEAGDAVAPEEDGDDEEDATTKSTGT